MPFAPPCGEVSTLNSPTCRGSAETLTGVYLGLLFFLLPLAMHDGYFDVVETKTAVFTALSALYLLGVLYLLVRRRGGFARRPLSAADGCLLAFWAIFVLACLLSGHAEKALWADDSRYQGILTATLYLLVWFAVSRSGGFTAPALAGALAGLGLVSLLAVINHLGGDPLGAVGRLGSFDRGRYVSTVGNINFLGAYIALLEPLCAALALREERRGRRALLCALAVLGLWAGMASRSESTVLGLAAGLLLLPLIPGGEGDPPRRVRWLWPAAVLSMEAFSLLSALAGGDGFSALTRLLLRPAAALTTAAIGTGLGFLAARSRRAYGLTLAALAAAGALFLLLANTVLPRESLGALGKFVVFDADWGTDRGRIWRSCWELFVGSSPGRKLIGGGAGCVARWDLQHRLFSDAVLDTAHNEYLQYLLTSGILGLAAYLGWLASAARRALRRPGALAAALLTAAAAYSAQALVNIAQPATTPLFFALMAALGALGA